MRGFAPMADPTELVRPNEFSAARIEERLRAQEQALRAVRVVAGNATDADDCVALLEMLGLPRPGEPVGPGD